MTLHPSAIIPILLQDIATTISLSSQQHSYVRFLKVKSHIGVTGNELADRLAKRAATQMPLHGSPDATLTLPCGKKRRCTLDEQEAPPSTRPHLAVLALQVCNAVPGAKERIVGESSSALAHTGVAWAFSQATKLALSDFNGAV
jgi:hypothetical protein